MVGIPLPAHTVLLVFRTSTERLVREMKNNDAPAEQYERLGLGAP